MPVVSNVDITQIPSDLRSHIEADPEIITDIIQDGFQQIRDDFDVRYAEDKEVITSMQVQDILRVASDDFDPKKGIIFGSRRYEMQDIDADMAIPRSQVMNIVKSYLRRIKNLGSVQEALDMPFETFFLREILQGQGLFLRENGSWKGDADNTQLGSIHSIDGLLLKLVAATASGELPADQVVAVAAFANDQAVYDHIQNLAEVYADKLPRLADSRAEIRLSRKLKRRYDAGRRAKFPQSVGPNETATHPDDFETLAFTTDVGLAGKDTVVITPPRNLFFATDTASAPRLEIVPDIKLWKVNVFFRAAFDIAYPKFVVRNNKV